MDRHLRMDKGGVQMGTDGPEALESLTLPNVTGLSARERRLVDGLLSGLSKSEAMRTAGYSESYVRTRASVVCSRNNITSAIRGAMCAAGITAQELAATMKAGLSASFRDGWPDFVARHKYLETALRIGGHEPAPESLLEESYEERIVRIRQQNGVREAPPRVQTGST
jgi:hypothetical protein